MVYLDHSATSYPTKYFAKDYYIPGNPNSPNVLGLQANQALNEARQRIMDCLGVRSGRVLFCRCATEAVEWLCRQFYEKDLIVECTNVEHDSVYDAATDYGKVRCLFGSDLFLQQYVNQITGTVYDIASIAKSVKNISQFFGSDFTASIGHHPIPTNFDLFCDSVWFSGHKFGCEPGIGAIWISDKLFKYLGGSEDSRNEYGLIHGTPNVSAAVAMSYAMEHAIDGLEDGNDEHWRSLLGYLEIKLLGNRIDCNIVVKNQPKTYAINAIHLPGFNADSLVQYLSSQGIYISPGHSACSNDAVEASRVLEAFGLTKEEASQTVRISFGESTTQEDIDALVKGIVEFKEMFV